MMIGKVPVDYCIMMKSTRHDDGGKKLQKDRASTRADFVETKARRHRTVLAIRSFSRENTIFLWCPSKKSTFSSTLSILDATEVRKELNHGGSRQEHQEEKVS